MYICTCCDQLWYKHSVTKAQNLKATNPDIIKYLLNKTSVDNAEWLYRSCDKYLKQNKVPPLLPLMECNFLQNQRFFI